MRPWQCLNFLPDPQGQAALRGVPAHAERGSAACPPLRGMDAPERPLAPLPRRDEARGAGCGGGGGAVVGNPPPVIGPPVIGPPIIGPPIIGPRPISAIA